MDTKTRDDLFQVLLDRIKAQDFEIRSLSMVHAREGAEIISLKEQLEKAQQNYDNLEKDYNARAVVSSINPAECEHPYPYWDFANKTTRCATCGENLVLSLSNETKAEYDEE